MTTHDDKPTDVFDASNINILAHDILEHMKTYGHSPYEKIAALRTAAHALENTLQSQAIKTAVVAGLQTIISAGNRA